MEGALKNAMMNDVEFRKGIPIDFFDYNGVQNIDEVFYLIEVFYFIVLIFKYIQTKIVRIL